MNNAVMPFERLNLTAGMAVPSAPLVVSILPLKEGLQALIEVTKNGQSGFSCSPHWVGHWAENVNPNIVILTASRGWQTVLAIALEIVDKSGQKIARFVGGTHANANFPALICAVSSLEANSFLAGLKSGLSAQPWAVDVIMLERQLETLGGFENPLLANGSSVSPNVSLHLEVNKSFDAVLETRSAKRKRKRYRSQQRKFESAGGFAIHNQAAKVASSGLLDQYFIMKSQQLENKGVANVFGNAKEQDFFKALFADPKQQHDHNFIMSSLDVGGKTRAIYGSSLHGLRQMVHFTAFAEDELTAASPGDFLNFAMIEAACGSTTEIYDLGVGNEGYKRSWCDIETWHRDTVVGITLRGKLAKLQFDIARVGKHWVKNNETLWALAKRIRKLKTGKNEEPRQANATEDGSEL